MNVHAIFFWQNCPDVFILPSSQRCPLERIQSLTWTIQGRQQNKNSVFLLLFFFKSNSNISHFDYKIMIIDYVIHQIYIKSSNKEMKITQPNLLYGWSLAFRRLHICRCQQIWFSQIKLSTQGIVFYIDYDCLYLEY